MGLDVYIFFVQTFSIAFEVLKTKRYTYHLFKQWILIAHRAKLSFINSEDNVYS